MNQLLRKWPKRTKVIKVIPGITQLAGFQGKQHPKRMFNQMKKNLPHSQKVKLVQAFKMHLLLMSKLTQRKN